MAQSRANRQHSGECECTLPNVVAAKHCPSGHTWQDLYRFFAETEGRVRAPYVRRDREVYPDGVMPRPCPICGDLGIGVEEADFETGEQFKESSSWREDGNHAELIAATSRRVRSEENLVAAFGVDLDVWVRTFFECGTYEGYAKREDKDLTFTAGVIDGHARSKGLIIAPMYRTKARFVRREPVPLRPVVQPVVCPVRFDPPRRRPARDGGVRRALVYADQHYGYERNVRNGRLKPFHDRRALDVVVQVAAHLQPDDIVLLGDLLDMTLWTDRFLRSAEYYFTTQPAILEAYRHLAALRMAAPNSRIVIVPGNHDARMRLALTKHLMEACELRAADEMHLPPAMSLPKLLALHQLHIEWVGTYPEGHVWLGPLRCRHGKKARAALGATAKAVAQGQDVDEAYGHVHRKEMVARRVETRDGWHWVKVWCPACTCHVDGRVPGSGADSNWSEGFGLVDYTEDAWTPTDVDIVDGRAVVDGRVFVGREDLEGLREDWPDWNW